MNAARVVFLCAAMFAPVAASVPASADGAAVPGHVILARAEGDALAIWDATPEVASIVSAKLSATDAQDRLEHDALRVLADVLPKVSSNARTVTVRILYSKTGDVSPVYGTPTFAGVERYANVEVKMSDAAPERDRWKNLGDKASLPSWVHVDVVGQLPPSQ